MYNYANPTHLLTMCPTWGNFENFGIREGAFLMGDKEMDSAIIVSMVTGGFSLAGIIITNVLSNRKIENQLVTSMAVTDTKIEALTEEVRKHNNFATRVPIIEKDIEYLKNDVVELKKGEKA